GGGGVCALVVGVWSWGARGRGPHGRAVSGAPAGTPGGRPGSVLGGTGVAVSRRVAGGDIPAARAHLRRLLAGPVQAGLVPQAGGAAPRPAGPGARARHSPRGGFYRPGPATRP